MSKKNCLNCVYFENRYGNSFYGFCGYSNKESKESNFLNREVLISHICSKHKPKQPLLKIINESREMSKKNQIPPEILDGFQEVANKYSDSPATTNAGRVLRFLVKILPVKLVAQIFSEKFK